MGLVETESLVVRSYNLAEADRIVVLLTRDHGVVRGVAKGVKKLKSRFGSSLEPFSIIKATYNQKDSSELVSLQKAELLRSNFRAASDPNFLNKFSYIGETLIALSPPHDPNEKLYRMMKACVEAASDDLDSVEAIGTYFELWMLRLSGYMPDWEKCDLCRRTISEKEDVNITSTFHLQCKECTRTSGRNMLIATELEMALSSKRLGPAEFAMAFRDNAESVKNLSNILKEMLARAAGRPQFKEIQLGTQV